MIFRHRARTPDEIVADYPSVTLEQVYATILYYLHNKEAVSQYIAEWLAFGRRMREEQARNPSPFVERVCRLKAERAVTKEAA